MEYKDEKIIALKKQMRNLNCRNIKEEGVYIKDNYLKFEPRVIFDAVKVLLPTDFIEMPEKVKSMKYPSMNSPERIITSRDTTVNFAFNWLEKIKPEQANELTKKLKSSIIKMNPSFICYEEREEKNPQGTIIDMFDFKSYGIDEQIYNMMCIVPLEHGTFHGIFNCLDRDSNHWKEIAWQVFFTTEVVSA